MRALDAPGEANDEPVYISAGGLARLATQAERALERYERDHPLRFAMPREELRGRMALGQREFAALLAGLSPGVEATADGVRREGWTPRLTAAQRRAADEAFEALTAGGLAPPRLDADPELIAYLDGAGRVVDCGDGVVMAAAAFDEASSAPRRCCASAARQRWPSCATRWAPTAARRRRSSKPSTAAGSPAARATRGCWWSSVAVWIRFSEPLSHSVLSQR